MNEIAKKEGGLAPISGIGGLSGLDTEDIVLPSVFLVQSNNKPEFITDTKGNQAKVGNWFHQTRKTEYPKLDVIILAANKTKELREVKVDGQKQEKEFSIWRLLLVTDKNLYDPFKTTFWRMGYWRGWKPFLNQYLAHLKENNSTNLWDYVVSFESEDYTNKDGESFKVPKLSIGRETNAEERGIIESIMQKYSPLLSRSDDTTNNEMSDEQDEIDNESLDEIMEEASKGQ